VNLKLSKSAVSKPISKREGALRAKIGPTSDVHDIYRKLSSLIPLFKNIKNK
jgi:hypothetical protein